MTHSPSRGLISTNTKTIKKSRPAPTHQDNDTKVKKYQTFGDLQKQQILADLWKGVIQILKIEFNDSLNLLVLLGEIPLDNYNLLLRKTLTAHVEGFVYSVKTLTQWRKKVKGWIQNQGRPETRGGLVVSVDRTELFRDRVIEILQNIPWRCFPTLQIELVRVLEEFHNQAQDVRNPKPFNPKTCSKHWWFNFIRKNVDIKEMWEDLPLERTVKKQQKNQSSKTDSILMSDVSSPSLEEEKTPSMNMESGTVSTVGESLLASPRNCRESYQSFVDFDDGIRLNEVPESPSRFFDIGESNLRGCFEFEEFDDEVRFDQIGSVGIEEEDGQGLLFSFLPGMSQTDC